MRNQWVIHSHKTRFTSYNLMQNSWVCNPLLHIKHTFCCLTRQTAVSASIKTGLGNAMAKSTLEIPHSCSLPASPVFYSMLSPSFPKWSRLCKTAICSLDKLKRYKDTDECPCLPSFKGVLGETFSLLPCWKALEGSNRLMPWIAQSCSWRSLFACFCFASSARSLETS